MRRFVLLTLGLLLVLPVNAQIMRSKSTTLGTRVVSTGSSNTNTQTWAYIGAGAGPVNTVGDFTTAVPYFTACFLEGGVMRMLSDEEGKAVPFVGVDVALGVSPDSDNSGLYFQSGPFLGLLIGKPSFRFDLRLQPSFSYCINGYRQEQKNYNVIDDGTGQYQSTMQVEDYGGVLLATEASIWLGHFNVGIRYIPLYSGIMGRIRWRF